MSRSSPVESLIEIPTASSALEYLPNVVPSSRVLPSSRSWIRLNKVLNAVPTTSADCRVVAVTVANEEEFHAKATKKVKGAKTSIKLIKNSARVANICADVIGDICGVLSGAISAMIASKITEKFGVNLQFVISAIVASLTVGGKALGKEVANNNSTPIVHFVGTFLNKFHK